MLLFLQNEATKEEDQPPPEAAKEVEEPSHDSKNSFAHIPTLPVQQDEADLDVDEARAVLEFLRNNDLQQTGAKDQASEWDQFSSYRCSKLVSGST